MKKYLLVMLALVGLTGCESTTSDHPVVSTTVYPVSLIVEQLAGDFATVNEVFPPGADVHSYEPTSQDMAKISESDLVIYVSDLEETFISSIVSGADDLQSLELITKIEMHEEEDHADEHHDEDDHVDTHIWLSPHELIEIVHVITDELIFVYPEHTDTINTNADALISELEVVDGKYAAFAQTQTKPIVVGHDAFSNLTDDYGFEFVPLYGAHHDDEPTSAELAQTIDLIKEDGINYIFIDENETNGQTINQVASESGAEVQTLLTLASSSDMVSGMTLIDCLEYNLAQMELANDWNR